jgi:hypothetical protein
MSLRYLHILVLLAIALPISASAQSLGDLARQVRAERQKSGDVQPRVITNDDIERSKPSAAPVEEATAEADSGTDQDHKASGSDAQAASPAAATGGKEAKKAAKDGKKLEEQELQADKRTDEINKRYLDRIAAIRAQISTAQKELARLQRDQIESTNSFERNVGTFPTIPEYQQQQRVFTEQIETTRNSITALNSQLEDAQEAARHAGVPHAFD